jgi:hypothetical protein
MTRSARGLALAALVALTALGVATPAPVRAAAPELQVVSEATYEVRPAERVVHVSVDGSATSLAPDSGGNVYYFDAMRLVIFGGVTHLSATASGAKASVRVVDGDDRQQVIEVALNRDLFYRETASFHLEYDLPTGSAGGDVRVGENVARFPVWAVGTSETAGSSVAISLPQGFQLDLQGEAIPPPTTTDDGSRTYRWDAIPDPDLFWLFATADQATISGSSYREYTSQASVPGQEVEIVVRAWADDPDWGTRTSARVTEALPVLGRLIGVRYFGTARLIVVETVSRSINGYAGIFDSSRPEDEIQVAFDADDTVTLHEVAHAWFNAGLSGDRWILEGFASYYGAAAAGELGIAPESFDLTDEERAVAFPLAEWGNVGAESELREAFAYSASLAAARELADRAGTDGLTRVFGAMADNESAYLPVQSDEVASSYSHPTNWHYFLDLLEERTGADYVDIMREWVMPREEDALLDERADARAAYAQLLSQLDGWEVSEPIRRQMGAWAFSSAEATIARASDVLARRDEIMRASAEVSLEVPLDAVQDDFEGDRLTPALATEAEIDASLAAYTDALGVSEEPVDLIEAIGLIGADPSVDLDEAATALEAGDWEAATTAANTAQTTWEAAAGDGTVRIGIVGGTLVVLLSGGGAALWVASRRRTRLAGLARDAGDVADPLDPGQDT